MQRRDFFTVVWSAALTIFLYRSDVFVKIRRGWILRDGDT